MAEPTLMYQGDLTDSWEMGHIIDDTVTPPLNAVLDNNYTCKMSVIGTSIDRAVSDKTDDNKHFIAQFTQAEADGLTPGGYTLVLQLTNLTLARPLREERHVPITILPQGTPFSAYPLVVENGTGLANADSYVFLADANAYWSPRSDSTWGGSTTTQKEIALRSAADYLSYAYLWPGQPRVATQALQWPRANAIDKFGSIVGSDSVPTQVAKAAILLAKEALTADLLHASKASASAGGVTSKTVKIGPLSVSTDYSEAASAVTSLDLPSFQIVDAILSDITRGKVARSGFASVGLIRR